MDPAVGDELGEGQPGHLAADRVEGRQQHALGGVVDHHVDAGGLLEGADVAALTADDPALHLVARQRHRGDHRFGGLIGGQSLNGADDDLPGLLVAVAARLGLDRAAQVHGLQPSLVLHLGEQLRLGGLRRHARDPGDLLALFRLRLVEGSPLGVQLGKGELQIAESLVELALQPGMLVFAFSHPAFPALHLLEQHLHPLALQPAGGIALQPRSFGVGPDALSLSPRCRDDLVGLGLTGQRIDLGDQGLQTGPFLLLGLDRTAGGLLLSLLLVAHHGHHNQRQPDQDDRQDDGDDREQLHRIHRNLPSSVNMGTPNGSNHHGNQAMPDLPSAPPSAPPAGMDGTPITSRLLNR